MIHSYNDYKKYIKEDSLVNIKRTRCSWLKMKLNLLYGNEKYCALHYLYALRKYEYSLNCQKGIIGRVSCLLAKIRLNRLSYKYKIHIRPNVVGYGFRIPHLVGGVIINCKSVGNYCIANSGVIVGNNSKGGLAIIGNNVDLTVGCKVIGGVIIGDNVIVAPNSVVVKDVPSNAIVTGIPARILKMQEQ